MIWRVRSPWSSNKGRYLHLKLRKERVNSRKGIVWSIASLRLDLNLGRYGGIRAHTLYLVNNKKKRGVRMRQVGEAMEGRRGSGVRCYCAAWWWSEWVKWVGDWVRRKLVKIKQKWAKTRHSKPEGSKNKGGQPQKNKGGKDKKAQGTKGRVQRKAARNTKKGRKYIYM